jgi:hypothetical protein
VYGTHPIHIGFISFPPTPNAIDPENLYAPSVMRSRTEGNPAVVPDSGESKAALPGTSLPKVDLRGSTVGAGAGGAAVAYRYRHVSPVVQELRRLGDLRDRGSCKEGLSPARGRSYVQLEAPEHPHSPFMMMVEKTWSFDVLRILVCERYCLGL